MTTAEYNEGYDFYPATYVNPYTYGSDKWVEWDTGYWAAHNDAARDEFETGGMEEAYGNFEAASDYWDDDPSPYSGTYSEM